MRASRASPKEDEQDRPQGAHDQLPEADEYRLDLDRRMKGAPKGLKPLDQVGDKN